MSQLVRFSSQVHSDSSPNKALRILSSSPDTSRKTWPCRGTLPLLFRYLDVWLTLWKGTVSNYSKNYVQIHMTGEHPQESREHNWWLFCMAMHPHVPYIWHNVFICIYIYIHSICSRLYCIYIYILCIHIKWYITLAPSNDSFYPRQPLVWSIAYLREQSKSEQVSLAKLKQVASFPSKELLCDAGTCGEEGLCKFARCHAEAVAYDHR